MKFSEVYAGKPDAGDEIREKGYQEFAENYIEPSGVNIYSTIYVKYYLMLHMF